MFLKTNISLPVYIYMYRTGRNVGRIVRFFFSCRIRLCDALTARRRC